MKSIFSISILLICISNLFSQVKIELVYNNGHREIITNSKTSFHTKLSGYQTSLLCKDESTWNSRTYATVKWVVWYNYKNRHSIPIQKISHIELKQSINCENHLQAAKSRCFPIKVYLRNGKIVNGFSAGFHVKGEDEIGSAVNIHSWAIPKSGIYISKIYFYQ